MAKSIELNGLHIRAAAGEEAKHLRETRKLTGGMREFSARARLTKTIFPSLYLHLLRGKEGDAHDNACAELTYNDIEAFGACTEPILTCLDTHPHAKHTIAYLSGPMHMSIVRTPIDTFNEQVATER